MNGDGILCDAFRDRKLLEHYLETAALKNDLPLADAGLLLALCQTGPACTRRELADFADLSRGGLTLALQRLSGKGLIKMEEARTADLTEKRLSISFTPEAGPILADLNAAQSDYEKARFAGFCSEELAQYRALSGRIKRNIQDVLQ